MGAGLDTGVEDAPQLFLGHRLGEPLPRPGRPLETKLALVQTATGAPLPVPRLAPVGIAPDKECAGAVAALETSISHWMHPSKTSCYYRQRC